MWGESFVSWTYVGLAIEAIQENQLMQRLFETRNLQNACIMWRLSTIHNSQKKHRSSSKGNLLSTEDGVFAFLHLLDMARSFEVTDLLDKIYGLLGFPTTGESVRTNLIIPNYTLSANEVYTQVTRSLLNKEQNLNILGLVLHTPADAPKTSHHIDGLPSAIAASGCNNGTVQAFGPSIPYGHLHKSEPYFHALFQWFNDAGVSMTTLAATLTAGRNQDGRLLSQQEKDSCVVGVTTSLKDYEFDLSELPTNAEGLCTGGDTRWQDTLRRFITYRQPFVRKSGKFGLGPRGTEVGDSVVMLWGGQFPFVAEKTETGQWILKGECFVKGWMEGDEVAALICEGGKEDVVFEFV